MKIVATMILASLVAQAGMFSAVSGMTMKEIKPTQEYTIDTAGMNPRIYEFTPVGDPSRYCVLVVLSGDEPSSTLQCYKKEK